MSGSDFHVAFDALCREREGLWAQYATADWDTVGRIEDRVRAITGEMDALLAKRDDAQMRAAGLVR